MRPNNVRPSWQCEPATRSRAPLGERCGGAGRQAPGGLLGSRPRYTRAPFRRLLARQSAVNRSEHTVVPASSRTVMRHSVPCQNVQPRSLSNSPAVVIAWVRAASRFGRTTPSSSGRSAPSLTLKKYRGTGMLRRMRAGALPGLSVIGARMATADDRFENTVKCLCTPPYTARLRRILGKHPIRGNTRSQNEPWTRRLGSHQISGSPLDKQRAFNDTHPP